MPDQGKGKTTAAARTGDFAGVRRRGGSRAEDRKAAAAALIGHAESTADASFLGTTQESGTDNSGAVATVVPSQPLAPIRATTGDAEHRRADDSAEPEPVPPAASAEPAVSAAQPEAAGEAPSSEGPAESVSESVDLKDAQPERALAAVSAPDQPPPARRRRSQPPGTRLPPMQQALLDSYLDSRMNSRLWDTHGVNMIPALWPPLRKRLSLDRKSSGNGNLGLGHYIDVALRQVRLDTDYLIGLHDQLTAELLGDLPRGRKTTLSLSPQARANADQVLELLEAADFARKGKAVLSALVLNLLRTLEKEGPLPKPELPPLI